MESVVTAVVTGALTLIGILVSNSRNQAVIEVKLDKLARATAMSDDGMPGLAMVVALCGGLLGVVVLGACALVTALSWFFAIASVLVQV